MDLSSSPCRHQRSVREAPQPRSCAYIEGGKKLLTGTNYGTLQVHDVYHAYELVEEFGAHIDSVLENKPILRLQVSLIANLIKSSPDI